MSPSEVIEEPHPTDGVVASETVANSDKHALQTKWCLWLRLPQAGGKGQNWQDSQICGHKFGTVEDFWCMFNNVRGPFEIGQCDYSIFRDNIQPAWEHPAFLGGGRINFSLPSAPPQRATSKGSNKHNDVWLHLVLALIGENFDEVGGSKIGGIRVVVKRNNVKVEIWISEMPNDTVEKLNAAISALIKPLLEDRDRQQFKVTYQSFASSY